MITPFEYLTVALSVVIGMGLSHLLTGFVGLVQERERVQFDWVHTVWCYLTFVGILFLWWSMWNLRNRESWDFFGFLLLVATTIAFFVASAFLVPAKIPDDGINLRAYFVQARAGIFGSYVDFFALQIVSNMRANHASLLPQALMASLVVPLIIAIRTTNRAYHAALAMACSAWLLGFIVLYGGKLVMQ